MRALRARLNHLRSAGVRIALDGFGAGEALAAPLFDLPFDLVKLAPQLVARAVHDDESRDGAEALITLAHARGADVVAVGIETQEQRHVMVDLGCDRLQGFLLALPVTPDAAEALLRDEADRVLF
jgi:EAL domain-containing protein (putative c-di-GMP-specific phosphodiesterase class I)